MIALAFLIATGWPAPSLDANAAAKVQKGEVVRSHSLDNGVIHYSMAARVEAPPAAVRIAARDVCASIERGDDKPTLTFLLAPGVDRFLKQAKTDVDDAALRALPATDCHGAGNLERYFVLADSPGHFPFPASKALIRVD